MFFSAISLECLVFKPQRLSIAAIEWHAVRTRINPNQRAGPLSRFAFRRTIQDEEVERCEDLFVSLS